MDKLAQKFNAQEMIKANSQAEAAEMKRLQLQVSEYEKILQEMRKLNYRNTELSEKMDALIGENASKITSMKEDEHKFILALRDLADEQNRNREAELVRREEERIEREKEAQVKNQNDVSIYAQMLEDKFKQSDEFVHKENVKVYRNVQAIVTEEINKQNDIFNENNKKLNAKMNTVVICGIITSLASVASLVLVILSFLGV